METKNIKVKPEEIKKLCKDILAQKYYQSLGATQKDSDHTPKVRWHAQGGLDLVNWLIEQNPIIMKFKRWP